MSSRGLCAKAVSSATDAVFAQSLADIVGAEFGLAWAIIGAAKVKAKVVVNVVRIGDDLNM